MFSPPLRRTAEELVARYPVGRSALLPLLHLVQAEDGYVTDGGVAEAASLLGLTKAEVAAVATFYSMYKRAPMGEHLVSVCTNFACAVRGAKEVFGALEEVLGCGHNTTSADGRFTLEHAECLGNCEGAPVVSVDYLNYECQTPQMAVELVQRIAAGEVPPPTRGPVPPGVREVSRILAGVGGGSVAASAEEIAATPADGAENMRQREAGDSGPADAAAARADVASTGLDADDVERETAYSPGEFQTDEAPAITVPEGGDAGQPADREGQADG